MAAAHRDRGEATTQLVILTPLLILLVFLGMQTAIYFHAANVASAAANRGAAAGSVATSSDGAAADEAQRTVDDLDGHAASAPRVGVIGGMVRVTVEVTVSRLLPFFPATVSRTAVEPRERFVPESQR